MREVVLSDRLETFATFRLQVNSRVLGKRLGKKMQEVIKASKSGAWTRSDGGVEVAGEALGEGDFDILLEPKEGIACQALASNDAIVVLDLRVDEELEQEGRARDLVRVVQQARREADLHVSDRIQLLLEVPGDWKAAAERFRGYIADQTLALELHLDVNAEREGFFLHEAQISGESIRIGLRRGGLAVTGG